MGRFVWKYLVPILVCSVGVLTWVGDPNEPIVRSIPIVPGTHQTEIALGFMAHGVILGLLLYTDKRKR